MYLLYYFFLPMYFGICAMSYDELQRMAEEEFRM